MRAQRYCKPAASSIFGGCVHIAIVEELFFGLCELFSVYFGCILVFKLKYISNFVHRQFRYVNIAWLSVCLMVSLDFLKT